MNILLGEGEGDGINMEERHDSKIIEHRITTVEEKQSSQTRRFEERLNAHDSNFEKVNDKIEEIVEMLSGRPTWIVLILVTGLSTITTG
jgi:hypothetical protein